MCGDDHDLIDGQPTGVVRVSLGYMSTFEDVDRYAVRFLLRKSKTCLLGMFTNK